MSASENLSPGQFQPERSYHGTAYEFAPGDLVDPACELGGRPDTSHAFMTTDPDVARNYGRHKAGAQRFIGNDDAEGRAYEVRPTGPVERDDTVADQFAGYRTRHSLQIVRDVTDPEPEREAGQAGASRHPPPEHF